MARTGVYRVSALARVWRRRHEVFPPYLSKKVCGHKVLSPARSRPRFPVFTRVQQARKASSG